MNSRICSKFKSFVFSCAILSTAIFSTNAAAANDTNINSNYCGTYVRDVITTATAAPGSGVSNFSLTKSKVHECESDGTYINNMLSNFFSQGNITIGKINAHGKTYII